MTIVNLCQICTPSAQNFKSFTVQTVAPGSCNFKKLIKRVLSILLREDDDLRNGAAVYQELAISWVFWVCKVEEYILYNRKLLDMIYCELREPGSSCG